MSTQDLREWYFQRILKNLPCVLSCFDEGAGIFRVEPGYDRLYWHCLRPLAYLYRNRIEGNPYYGDASVLDKVIRQGDAICGSGGPHSDRQHGSMGVEWIPFNIMDCIDWLVDDLGAKRRAIWTEALAAHLDDMMRISNYVSTAPNHFAWRAALLTRAGQLFDNENWRRTGQLWARQVCKMQLPDGYWDESRRGQGPSPSYHRTHLHGLDLYYRFSGDEQVRESLYKAIDFAVRASYVDGTPIEAFDGRQPYLAAFAAGMAANALSRTPQGRRLIRRQIERMDELGVTDATRPCGFSVHWYVFATTDFMLDCYRFLEDGPEEELPQERQRWQDRFTFNGYDTVGGGAIVRQAPWLLAISAAQTDNPRVVPNVYITERQSNWSIYHDRAGLVLGGGNRMRNHVPLANAIVLTGWKDVDCVAGRFPDSCVQGQGCPTSKPGQMESNDPVKGCYYPIQRRLEVREQGASLFLEFLHASILFDLRIAGPEELVIDYAFEAAGTTKILLQVPIPLFWPGRFRVDDRQVEVADLEDVRTLPVSGLVMLKARGTCVRYTLPAGQTGSLTYPLEPIKNWKFAGMNYVPDVRFQPLYTVAMLSREFREQHGQGSLLTVRVQNQ